MENKVGLINARNIIATIKGKKYPGEKIIVCGHYDSWDLATGATDNGLGSFSVLDMARTFKKLDLQTDRTIEFVLFMGEEEGLLGSEYFVKHALQKKNAGQIRYVFNFDMSGATIGFGIGGRKEAELFFKNTGTIIQQVDTVFKNRVSTGAGLHSDHQPFMLQGIPTASAVGNMPSSIFKCYHSDCDRIDLIQKSWMVDNVRFASMMIYSMANAEKIPAARLTDEQTKQLLIENGLKEALLIAGKWRWSE
jgi:Zn-dependent M28 family amino/carboxypeptidase